MAAAALLVFATAFRFSHADSVASRQMVFLAYLFVLVEFAWCAVAHFEILNATAPLNNYWNTVGPILRAFGRSARVLLPVLLIAFGLVATNRKAVPKAGSLLLFWAFAAATANVIFAYLALHFVCWYGMRRGDYRDWDLH